MTLSRLLPVLLILFPFAGSGQKKEIIELQRDMALLQDQIRQLQRSVDEKLAALTVLVQQSVDGAGKANTAVAVLDSTLRERLREQEKTLVGPVAGLGTRIDQMADEFRSVREAVAEINSKTSKLQTQLVDLGNAVKTLQAPPAPPPSATTTAAPTGPPAGVSAESLYNDARRDMIAGSFDLALQEFSDYLKYFPNTDYAPNAQFYIGQIHYNKGDLPAALQGFDLVLERFAENNKTPDAMLMRGKTLVKMGERTAAGQEFRALLKRFPTGEMATRARAELKALGYSLTAPPSQQKKRR